MSFTRQLPRLLDEEHRASLALLDRLEHTLMRGSEADVAVLAKPLLGQIDEMARHFGFEEAELFPRLSDAGDAGIATLLAAEHDDIRAVCAELRPLALARAGSALAPDQRADFKRLALELAERVVAHIQKETMALLPLLEDLLDEDTDRALALAHAGA